MKNNKIKLSTTKHYHSFAELTGFSYERTQNVDKLAEQRASFMKMYGTCHVCNSEWRFIKDTNILICSNPACKGKATMKAEEENDNKTENVFAPSFLYLRPHSADVANTLFD